MSRIVYVWCQLVLKEGDKLVSHRICEKCKTKLEEEMADTIEQKLYQAHELLKEVLLCLDINTQLHYDLFTAQNLIFLVGRNLPRNLLSYKPTKGA